MNFDLMLGQTETFNETKEDYVNGNTEVPLRVRFSEPLKEKDSSPSVLDITEPVEAQVPFMFGSGDK